MQNKPSINTAIPKQRHQLGEYQITILGEVDSNDPLPYQFIAAFVEEGGSEPKLYVTCEKRRKVKPGVGRYRVRIINEVMKEVIEEGDEFGDLSVFAETVVEIGRKMLSLSDEVPHQMM